MNIKSVTLWSKYTRLLHWSLALAVLFLAFSAWLMGEILDDLGFWVDWHQIVGQITAVLLIARIALLFTQGNSHYSRFKISKKDSQVIKETLKFYLSLARTPLPSWFAFNPVWRILYVAFYIMLAVMVISGFINENTLWLGIYWPSMHQFMATAIYIWLSAHVLAMFLHDWKGRVNRVSAMINGVAYFESESGVANAAPQENVIKTSFNLQDENRHSND